MQRRALALVVAAGSGPLSGLQPDGDAALTPFAGKYRFIDLALATATNSDIGPLYVAAARPSVALRAHLMRAARAGAPLRRVLAFPSSAPAQDGGRAGPLLRALAAAAPVVRQHRAHAVVALTADHVLQLDLRQLLGAHAALGAEVTFVTLPVPLTDPRSVALEIAADRRVLDAGPPASTTTSARGFAFAWTGDLVVNASALPALLALGNDRHDSHHALLTLVSRLPAAAYDALDNRVPGTSREPYWHDPLTLEAYYDAQMHLCTPTPALDLYNADWPLVPAPSGLGPAKVVADAAGRAGQALNSLVSDGVLIRGGTVINTVLGHGVAVESGAEVEDSVLLEGCRIGPGARVRRALIGAGAVVGAAGEIGYDASPAAPARVVRSGLTLLPRRETMSRSGEHEGVAARG